MLDIAGERRCVRDQRTSNLDTGMGTSLYRGLIRGHQRTVRTSDRNKTASDESCSWFHMIAALNLACAVVQDALKSSVEPILWHHLIFNQPPVSARSTKSPLSVRHPSSFVISCCDQCVYTTCCEDGQAHLRDCG